MKPGILALFSFILVVLAGSGALQPAPARAKLVTIEITAEVDTVADPHGYLAAQINVGDIIVGTYTYDTSLRDMSGSHRVGDYRHSLPPAGVALTVGGIEFETDPTNVDFWVGIVNDYPPLDNYTFISRTNIASPALPVPIGDIYWILEDPTGSALSSDILSEYPPRLRDWEFNRLYVGGPDRGASFGIVAHVISAVPEPTSILFLAWGAVLLRKYR